MIEIGLGHYLTLSAIIFTIGIFGIYIRYSITPLFIKDKAYMVNDLCFVNYSVLRNVKSASR